MTTKTKQLMYGTHAAGEAAIQAGCTCYFGYPITPQNELPEYMSRRLPEVGGVFIQAESELASINMVLGASVAGARAMTSSSSPGISLKQEGISFHGGHGAAGGDRQYHARRARARQYRPGPVRLFSGNARRRPRRLPHAGAGAGLGAGACRPDLSGL